MIIDDLKTLKQRSGMTNQQIADKSGVPLATVNRIMSGQTDNPTYQTIADLAKALGGNTDIMPTEATKDSDLYERIIETKNKWILRLFLFAIGMVVILVFLVLFDLFNRSTGYIR